MIDVIWKPLDGLRIHTLKRFVRRPEQRLENHILVKEIQESEKLSPPQPLESARRG